MRSRFSLFCTRELSYRWFRLSPPAEGLLPLEVIALPDVINCLTQAVTGTVTAAWTYDKNSNHTSAAKTDVPTKYSTCNTDQHAHQRASFFYTTDALGSAILLLDSAQAKPPPTTTTRGGPPPQPGLRQPRTRGSMPEDIKTRPLDTPDWASAKRSSNYRQAHSQGQHHDGDEAIE